MEHIRSFRDRVHADRQTVTEIASTLSDEELEHLETAATEHRAGTPSVVSLSVDRATGVITSPNGDFNDESTADFMRLRREILAKHGLSI